MSDLATAPLEELVDALQQRGVKITLEDGSPKVRGWRKVSPAERERLRAERDALIALLRADEETLEPAPPKPKKVSEEDKPTWKPPTERHARRRAALRNVALTEKGIDALGHVLETVPEKEMSDREVLVARLAFGRRFGLPGIDRYRR